MDFPSSYVEVHAVERVHAGKALRDPPHLKRERAPDGRFRSVADHRLMPPGGAYDAATDLAGIPDDPAFFAGSFGQFAAACKLGAGPAGSRLRPHAWG